MNTRLAQIISFVFHPLLMPTLVLGLLFFITPHAVGVDVFSDTTRLMLLGFVSMITFVVPSLCIYYLYRGGYIRTLQMDSLPDRRLPYLLVTLLYGSAAYFFGKRLGALSEIAPQIGIILGSIACSIALVAVISWHWKISAHSVGTGGSIGMVAGIIIKLGQPQLFHSLLWLILASGWVAGARLQLGAHTPLQIWTGLLLGFCVSIVTVWFFL
ncbi:MAG: hypothetical protein ACK4GN_00650 [Runella sp.]